MPKKETKRCKYCGKEFKPHVRQKDKQVACFNTDCQKAHKKFLNHRPTTKKSRKLNNKLWRKYNKDKISDRNRRYYQKNKTRFWEVKNIKE